MTGPPDSHCHLSHVDRPVPEVLEEAAAAGIDVVIDIGMGLAGSADAVARAHAFDSVRASVGIHPNDLDEFDADPDRTMAKLAELSRDPNVVGIGETGLDFYRDRWGPDIQERAFRAHIALAKEADRALVIHCRDAHDDVLRVLDDAGAPARVVMHCFSGDARFGEACAAREFFCSFAGNLTYTRSDALREVARSLPEELLLVETDAPFLAPHPFRGKPNHPALVVHTARVLADVRSESFDALVATLRNNTQRAFRIG